MALWCDIFGRRGQKCDARQPFDSTHTGGRRFCPTTGSTHEIQGQSFKGYPAPRAYPKQSGARKEILARARRPRGSSRAADRWGTHYRRNAPETRAPATAATARRMNRARARGVVTGLLHPRLRLSPVSARHPSGRRTPRVSKFEYDQVWTEASRTGGSGEAVHC
jgi:hypothetical protein